MTTQKRPVIAIDFGGVLGVLDHSNPKDRTADHFKTDVDMPGAREALAELGKTHDLVLVSYCGRARAIETRNAINRELPGVFSKQYFVRRRDFKGFVCTHIGASVMIDDRTDVLKHIIAPCQPVLFSNWAALAGKTWSRVEPIRRPDGINEFLHLF
jgi:hypothetical protein